MCLRITRVSTIKYLTTLYFHIYIEAQYNLRKLIIDVAKRHIKELEKLNMNAVLGHTAQKSKQLDERFEDFMVRT